MRIKLTASGSLSRHIDTLAFVRQIAGGEYEFDCAPPYTVGQLILALGLAGQPLLCIVDERSIPAGERERCDLAPDSRVALVPPIRAG